MKNFIVFVLSFAFSQSVVADIWNQGSIQGVTVAEDGFAYFWLDDNMPSGFNCNWINVQGSYRAVYTVDLSTTQGHAMYGIAINSFKKDDVTVFVRTSGDCIGEHMGGEAIFLQQQ